MCKERLWKSLRGSFERDFQEYLKELPQEIEVDMHCRGLSLKQKHPSVLHTILSYYSWKVHISHGILWDFMTSKRHDEVPGFTIKWYDYVNVWAEKENKAATTTFTRLAVNMAISPLSPPKKPLRLWLSYKLPFQAFF